MRSVRHCAICTAIGVRSLVSCLPLPSFGLLGLFWGFSGAYDSPCADGRRPLAPVCRRNSGDAKLPQPRSHRLTLAYEEPKYSILLRIIEEYVDSHLDDVEKGRWRMSHYRSEGWDDEDAEDACGLQGKED